MDRVIPQLKKTEDQDLFLDGFQLPQWDFSEFSPGSTSFHLLHQPS